MNCCGWNISKKYIIVMAMEWAAWMAYWGVEIDQLAGFPIFIGKLLIYSVIICDAKTFNFGIH